MARRRAFTTGCALPGIARLEPLPDVMRGEEMTIFGIDGLLPDLVVLPGAHSKWVRTDGQKIIDLTTYMSDEILRLGRVDNTYLDWEGTALRLHEGSTVQLQSTAAILHVFSPASSAGFCCLEPQTAVPNAANFGADGGNLLSPGERMAATTATMTHRGSPARSGACSTPTPPPAPTAAPPPCATALSLAALASASS
ncbi:MAG: 2-dehydro-3-deoxygalactonokinase [Devosia sp.]